MSKSLFNGNSNDKKDQSFGFSFNLNDEVDLIDEYEQQELNQSNQSKLVKPLNDVYSNSLNSYNKAYRPSSFHTSNNRNLQNFNENNYRRLEPLNNFESNYYLLPLLNLTANDEPTKIREPRSWLELSSNHSKLFHSFENSDQSNERWENVKSSLTNSYKKRHREALKSNKRKLNHFQSN